MLLFTAIAVCSCNIKQQIDRNNTDVVYINIDNWEEIISKHQDKPTNASTVVIENIEKYGNKVISSDSAFKINNRIVKYLAQYKKLEHLVFFSCDLYNFPNEIDTHLINLKSITFSCCRIKTIPDLSKLSKIEAITILDKEQHHPTGFEVEGNVWHFTERNLMRTLPTSLYKLRDLKQLSIIGIRLDTIPPGISELSNLEQLSIKYTYNSQKKYSITTEIGKMKKLKSYTGYMDSLSLNLENTTHLENLYLYLPHKVFQNTNKNLTFPIHIKDITINIPDTLSILPAFLNNNKNTNIEIQANRIEGANKDFKHIKLSQK